MNRRYYYLSHLRMWEQYPSFLRHPKHFGPNMARAAIAANYTTSSGWINAISVSTHGRQGPDLHGVRLLMDSALPACFELEVLHCVCHLHKPPGNPSFFQGFVKQFARGTFLASGRKGRHPA